jgi:hypothetical protein
MIDEGCQTIGLEEGGAAEALASFARQSMNVGRDSYPFLDGTAASNAIPQPEASFENALTTGQPPTFQVQHIDDLERLSTNQIAPQSPHLQPVSSEFLPQVSPLLSRNTLFTANFQSTARVENTQSLPLQSQVAQINSQTAVADAEDLYRASPAGRRGEQVEVDVPAFHSPLAEINGVEPPVFENHYNAEDQYGHWQSSTHLSHHASPYQVTEAASEDAQEDRFYVEEGGEEVEQYSHNGFPASHAEMLHSHQYPEIDDGLPDQHLSGWGPGAPGVPYPDLQDHELEDNTAMHPLQPRSTAMSRSQSGQSQVVDLTESSDEEGEGPVEGALEEDGSQLEDEEEIREDEDGSLDEQVEQVADVVRSRHFPQRDALDHEEDFDVEGIEGEEQYYDDGLEDEGADTIDQRFNVPPGQEFYDEEGEEYESEDEDMEGEGPPRPSGQREPEVIDLLSSDDEDSAPPPQVKPTSSATPRYPQAPSYESETTEVEEDSDSEDSVSYAEREEFRVHKANRNLSREESIEEDDEIMKDEREQDDSEQSVGKSENESEIAAHHERDPARESMVECVDHQHLGDGRRVDNDLANVESAQDEEQPVEPDKVVDVIIAEVENRVKTAIPGQFGRSQTSPSKSSVFRRLFNLDGANDEPEEEISYPTLPRDEPSPPASDQQTVSQPSDILFKQTTNTQLPTPDATQSFGQTISTETSFTSNIEALPLSIEQPQESDTTTIKMETEQVEVVVDTSGPVDIEVEMEQIETTAVTNGAAKIKLADEDIEMGQAEATKTIEQPKSTENEPPEDQVVEERTVKQEHTLDNLDRESIEPETVQEQIDQQIMEEKLDLHAEEPESIESADIHEQIDEQFAEEEHSLEVAEPESLEPDAVQERIDEQILEDAIELKANDPKPIEIEPTEDAIAVEEPDHKSTEDSITVESSPPKQTEGVDTASKEPEFTVDSPRRSNRRAKPTAILANTKENVRPTTPTKVDHGSARTRKEPASPRVALDTRAPPKGHDASIELALASLESPSKQQHDLRKPPVVDLKLRLSRALRTELSEFTALKVLRYHLNQKLDVLAVATATPAEPLRAKNGPRHYQITFNVTDPSVAPSGVTEIQIFRPYKDALPIIQAGDGILLRNFQVMSVKSRGFGLRSVQDEGSSWVVFKDGGEPEVRGPPVEFGDGEKNHVTALRAWYATLDAAAMSKICRANGDKAGTGVGKSIAK